MVHSYIDSVAVITKKNCGPPKGPIESLTYTCRIRIKSKPRKFIFWMPRNRVSRFLG